MSATRWQFTSIKAICSSRPERFSKGDAPPSSKVWNASRWAMSALTKRLPAWARLIAKATSSGAPRLVTKPHAPARSAWVGYGASQAPVTITTWARQSDLTMRRVASSPPMPGMAISNDTTCGSSLRVSSTASSASSASPMTSIAFTSRSSRITPARNSRWLSATMVLIIWGCSAVFPCASKTIGQTVSRMGGHGRFPPQSRAQFPGAISD